MIEISHLVKKYGNHYAVNDLSVRIEEGQIYGFLGPNGGGKIDNDEHHHRLCGAYVGDGDGGRL